MKQSISATITLMIMNSLDFFFWMPSISLPSEGTFAKVYKENHKQWEHLYYYYITRQSRQPRSRPAHHAPLRIQGAASFECLAISCMLMRLVMHLLDKNGVPDDVVDAFQGCGHAASLLEQLLHGGVVLIRVHLLGGLKQLHALSLAVHCKLCSQE